MGFLHSHTFLFHTNREFLSPFALWLLNVTAALVGRYSHDYYGDSVALGLSTRRQSRSAVISNVEDGLGVRSWLKRSH